jgi:hypothetical protein
MGIINQRRAILLSAIAIPFLIITGLLIKYGVNVPVTDQYELIPLFQKQDNGTLGIKDLWQQHNEHRIFFPNILLFLLAQITHWNIRAEIATSLILSFIAFCLLAWLILKTIEGQRAQIAGIFLSGLWFFSPVQWQNWLWGWQVEWFLCICASIAVFITLVKSSQTQKISLYFICAILLSIITSYSLASGLFIWVAGLTYLLLCRSPFNKILVWLASAAVCYLIYFYGYKAPSHEGPLSAIINHPIAFIRFFFAFLGRPISSEPYAAVLSGVVLLTTFFVLVTILYRKNLLARYAIWLSICVYVLFAGIAISSGRIDLGIINALSSRYTAFSLLFIISFTIIISDIIFHYVPWRKLKLNPVSVGIILTILVLPFLASSYYNGVVGMKIQSANFREIKWCTDERHPSDACLYEAYFPSRDEALNRLNYLKHKHWGGY